MTATVPDMAILPLDTAPPTWVTIVEPDPEADVDGSRSGEWKAPVGDSVAGVLVCQWFKREGNRIRLSEPWVDMEAEVFRLTPREARTLSRDLVKAAQLLDRATEATWEMLGAAGQ